jgi:long-chain acyl-CoA synthetase
VLDHHGYHTGDQSYQDEDGFFFLTGRKDNLLKVGGHKINPQEVENAIMETELAVETAVIGVPDDLLGHKMVALVAPKSSNCTETELLRSCAEKLPKYKLPGKVKLIRALPKNLSGKIDRAKCVELAKS